MTGFDYVVLLVIAVCAIGGFFRGFVEEVLSLAAWCIALIAVHTLHEPLTLLIAPYLKNETGAGLLAFALLMIIPFVVGRFAARTMGSASRNSLLGPIDRVLGFGFGAVKGFIIMVLAFSLVVFAYDVVWGPDGRPAWIAQARTYPFLNAASEELMTMIASRRAEAADAAAGKTGDSPPKAKAKPGKHKAKHKPAAAET